MHATYPGPGKSNCLLWSWYQVLIIFFRTCRESSSHRDVDVQSFPWGYEVVRQLSPSKALVREPSACLGRQGLRAVSSVLKAGNEYLADNTVASVWLAACLWGCLLYQACEILVPRLHRYHLLACKKAPHILHNVTRIKIWNECAPSCANAFCSIDEYERQDWYVPVVPLQGFIEFFVQVRQACTMNEGSTEELHGSIVADALQK